MIKSYIFFKEKNYHDFNQSELIKKKDKL